LCGDVGIARELFAADSEGEAERRKGSGTPGSGGWTQPDVAFFFISYTLINAVMMVSANRVLAGTAL
jgi:hypothetical protein